MPTTYNRAMFLVSSKPNFVVLGLELYREQVYLRQVGLPLSKAHI